MQKDLQNKCNNHFNNLLVFRKNMFEEIFFHPVLIQKNDPLFCSTHSVLRLSTPLPAGKAYIA